MLEWLLLLLLRLLLRLLRYRNAAAAGSDPASSS